MQHAGDESAGGESIHPDTVSGRLGVVRGRAGNRMSVVYAVVLVMVIVPAALAARGAQGSDGVALFGDLQFRQGFLLSYPDSSKGRSVEAVLHLDDVDKIPVWRLCQWGTKHTLANAPCVRSGNGDLSYGNEAKKVIVGGSDSPNQDLVLELRAKAEYGTNIRRSGESWPHLLVEQDAIHLHPLDELDGIQFDIMLRLLYCTNYMTKDQFDPGLHAAQFQMFFIIKNISPASENHGGYYWFGVPFCDSRYDVPPAYMAKDAGKDDATGRFIYTVDGKAAGMMSLTDGQWVTLHVDLLPHIKDGLQEAVRRGYLKSSDPADYAVANMNLGWEVPGTFDGAMQVKNLNIRAYPGSGSGKAI